MCNLLISYLTKPHVSANPTLDAAWSSLPVLPVTRYRHSAVLSLCIYSKTSLNRLTMRPTLSGLRELVGLGSQDICMDRNKAIDIGGVVGLWRWLAREVLLFIQVRSRAFFPKCNKHQSKKNGFAMTMPSV